MSHFMRLFQQEDNQHAASFRQFCGNRPSHSPTVEGSYENTECSGMGLNSMGPVVRQTEFEAPHGGTCGYFGSASRLGGEEDTVAKRVVPEDEHAPKQHNEYFAYVPKEGTLQLLECEGNKITNKRPFLVNKPFLLRAGTNGLDERVFRKPTEVADGMNCNSAFAGESGCILRRNALRELSVHSSNGRRLSPVVRMQSLCSPSPHGDFLAGARPVARVDAEVQTEATVEDVAAAKPLTIEFDETLTRPVKTSNSAASSLSTLDVADVRETNCGAYSCFCSDVKQFSMTSLNMTEMETTVHEATGRKAAATVVENRGDAGSVVCEKLRENNSLRRPCVPQRMKFCCSNGSLPIDTHARVRPQVPKSRGIPSLPNNIRCDSTVLYCAPGISLSTAWYLPNSRVMEHAEFKNLLCAGVGPQSKEVSTLETFVPQKTAFVTVNSPFPATLESVATEILTVKRKRKLWYHHFCCK